MEYNKVKAASPRPAYIASRPPSSAHNIPQRADAMASRRGVSKRPASSEGEPPFLFALVRSLSASGPVTGDDLYFEC